MTAFDGFAWMASLHHEKLDGSGYPFGLRGEALDVASRILVVSDIYDALTSDRPYRRGMTQAAALELMQRDRAIKLCPDALDALEAARGPGSGVVGPVANPWTTQGVREVKPN